jgi:hypothetical protein
MKKRKKKRMIKVKQVNTEARKKKNDAQSPSNDV